MKIIAAIDLMDGQVVRLLQGRPENKTVYGNTPLETAKRWERAGADMLHIVDLDATLGRGSNLQLIKDVSGQVSIPVEIAGGLRTRQLVDEAMGASARIVLGTLAFRDRALLRGLIEEYGSERIVISVDHAKGDIMINGWQEPANMGLFEGMEEFMAMGLCEFLLTDVGRDGTMRGPDLETLRQTRRYSDANVISSGGISSVNDVKDVKKTGAFGVILGKALYENRVSIEEAKAA